MAVEDESAPDRCLSPVVIRLDSKLVRQFDGSYSESAAVTRPRARN